MLSRARSICGALALCALALCAFGAASASAAAHLTAVECVKAGLGHKFESSHCETNGKEGEYETEVISGSFTAEGTSTSSSGGAETSRLSASIGGANTIVTCGDAKTMGAGENVAGGVTGKEITVTYSECHAVLKSNEARTCNVEGITGGVGAGKVQTTKLKSSTTGVEHKVKFEPETPELFTEFKILTTGTECFFGTAQTVAVTGSVEGEANTTTHSHLTFTEANNGTLLRIGSKLGAIAHYTGTYGTWTTGLPEKTVGLTTFEP